MCQAITTTTCFKTKKIACTVSIRLAELISEEDTQTRDNIENKTLLTVI